MIDVFFSLVKVCLKLLVGLLKNPYFDILLILTILLRIFYPRIRGSFGEFLVKIELKKLNKSNYKVLNNIIINENGTTHQIDHIVISRFGIFVIEMKNYYGMIVGEEYKDRWIQYLGKNKYFFQNPIQQNYGHAKSLEMALDLEHNNFIPIVCFSNQAKLEVKTRNIVVQLDDLIELIKKFQKVELDLNLDEIEHKIVELNLKGEERKKHINNVKAKLKNYDDKVGQMVCPKCNGKLIEKSGKYGTFIGCSNYPKCKYIKK